MMPLVIIVLLSCFSLHMVQAEPLAAFNQPRIMLARVGENVNMELNLTFMPVLEYTIKNQDTGMSLVFEGNNTLNETKYIFSDDKDNIIKFMIQNVQLSDAGHIVATGEKEVISADSIVLVVTDKPTKPVISTNGSTFAGEDAVFFCNAKSTSSPDYYRYKIPLKYKWYLDNNTQSTTANKHVIYRIQKTYINKILTCEAVENDTVSDQSDPKVINPLYGPEDVIITPNVSRIEITENSTVGNFTCSADCNPACRIKWNLKNISGDFIPLSRNRSISIGVVNRTRTGYVRCVAKTSFPRDNLKNIEQFYLDILYPPVITSVDVTPSAIRRENESASLICKLDSNPKSDVTWIDDNTGLPVTKQTTSSSLNYTFPRLECSHTGYYTCKAVNRISMSGNRTLFLNVTCSPRLDSKVTFKREYGAQMDVPFAISFQVISNPHPQPYISLASEAGVKVQGPIYTTLNLYTYKVSATITVIDSKGFGTLMVRIRGKEENHNITIKAADATTTQSESESGSLTMLIGTVAAAIFILTIVAGLLWIRKKTQTAYSKNQNEVAYAKVDEVARQTKKQNDPEENNVFCNEATAMISDEKQHQPQPDAEDFANTNRTQNKDGLIYIDVEFTKSSASNETKPTMIIHGDDERTEYMSVDFTQAPPILPPEETMYGNT